MVKKRAGLGLGDFSECHRNIYFRVFAQVSLSWGFMVGPRGVGSSDLGVRTLVCHTLWLGRLEKSETEEDETSHCGEEPDAWEM
ncbi:hypothetical protein AGOR_G00107990 [Albula goreensis]|uniref:Uncharacterized protein n=1 Tax=Albula goreensis TaxID=1534307 RepID=A0A8T3DKS4_9TELE|nr:hypothetical protein AGOR_G00107990 [Albula goreensis]